MLIIAIHGYALSKDEESSDPRDPDQETGIGVWKNAIYIKKKILGNEDTKNAEVKIIRLRYKHIVYMKEFIDHCTEEPEPAGFTKIQELAEEILREQATAKQTPKKPLAGDVIIIGHSLGGWAAMHLVKELFNLQKVAKLLYGGEIKDGTEVGIMRDLLLDLKYSNVYVEKVKSGGDKRIKYEDLKPIDLLVQIEPLPITTNSPLYTESGFTMELLATMLENYGINTNSSFLKNVGNALVKAYGKIESVPILGDIFRTAKKVMTIGDDAQALLEYILGHVDDGNLNVSYLRPSNDQNPYLGPQQHIFGENEVTAQWNFISNDNVKTTINPVELKKGGKFNVNKTGFSNLVVEAATGERTRLYRSKSKKETIAGKTVERDRIAVDESLPFNHTQIDDESYIYDEIYERIIKLEHGPSILELKKVIAVIKEDTKPEESGKEKEISTTAKAAPDKSEAMTKVSKIARNRFDYGIEYTLK